MNKLVSIIVPCYQQQHLLYRSISSCISQSYEKIEIIIVDDGSLPEVTLKDFPSDKRIKLIRTENIGLPAARNLGLKYASGAYVKFLDSDDRLRDNCIKIQVSSMENFGSGYVSVIGYTIFNEQIEKPIYPKFDRFIDSLLLMNIGPPHCFLYFRQDIDKIDGFDTSEKTRGGHEDYDLNIRLALNGCEAITVHQIGADYYQSPESMSRQQKSMYRTRNNVLTHASFEIVNNWHKFDDRTHISLLTGLVTTAEQTGSAARLLSMIQECCDQMVKNQPTSTEDYSFLFEPIKEKANYNSISGNFAWREIVNAIASIETLYTSSAEVKKLTTRQQVISLDSPFYGEPKTITDLKSVKTLIENLAGQVSHGEKTVLWGSGYWGEFWLRWLLALNITPIGFIDSKATMQKKEHDGFDVFNPSHVIDLNPDKIIICSYAYFEEIKEHIIELGYENSIVDLKRHMEPN